MKYVITSILTAILVSCLVGFYIFHSFFGLVGFNSYMTTLKMNQELLQCNQDHECYERLLDKYEPIIKTNEKMLNQYLDTMK